MPGYIRSGRNPIRASIAVLFFTAFLLLFGACKKESNNMLWVSKEEIDFSAEGGNVTIYIKTDAPDGWAIENPSDWVELSKTSSPYTPGEVEISVATRTLEPREATLLVSAGNAPAVSIKISQASSEFLYHLSSSETLFEFNGLEANATFTVTTNAPQWSLTDIPDWIVCNPLSGTAGETTVEVQIPNNMEGDARVATVNLMADAAPMVALNFSQLGGIYPSYNTNPLAPDNTGMSRNAQELAAAINIGWNIGNTLEATGGETAWGNPKVTNELIQLVKQSGFNAIRIPCSWNQYMENSTTAKLRDSWLNRVKEVVQYCVDNDLYAIVNIHWDGGWLENNITPDKQVENNAKQKAFWEQIATHLRDFDERVLFAGANEPNVEDAEQMEVLLSYHQTFVDAVRSTGGRNSYRTLIVQGPSTDIDKTNQLMHQLPADEIEGRMMAEIHFYTPYQYCLMTEDAGWGKMFYYWGNGYHSTTDTERNSTWGEEADVDALFGKMKTQFVDKGIPVILGEFGAVKRTFLTGDALQLHLDSRAYYLKYLMQQAKVNGLLPFYWDAGNLGENTMSLFNRQNNSVYDQQALDALMEGINGGN